MNIGIDIDGVLTDLEKFIKDYGTKFCEEEKIPLEIKDIYYSEEETFNWTPDQTEKFWNKYLVKYVVKSDAREFSAEVIEKLRKEGNKIYIITARDESGMPEEYYGKMQQLTIEWLKAKNIKYDKLIFVKDKEKLQKCIDNEIDFMIEDNPNNILNISNKIKVIKYDCQYNKKIEGKNITTAFSWYHIYNILKK